MDLEDEILINGTSIKQLKKNSVIITKGISALGKQLYTTLTTAMLTIPNYSKVIPPIEVISSAPPSNKTDDKALKKAKRRERLVNCFYTIITALIVYCLTNIPKVIGFFNKLFP